MTRSSARRVGAVSGGILDLRGAAAADVTLRLVDVQHLPYLPMQKRVDQLQPFRHILVHGGLADAKHACRIPYRCAVFDDIVCGFIDSFLNIIAQYPVPPDHVCTGYAEFCPNMLVSEAADMTMTSILKQQAGPAI